MLQIELKEGQVITNTKEHNGVQMGYIRFTSETTEKSLKNPMMRNLVKRSCIMAGPSRALELFLLENGIIDKSGVVDEVKLNNNFQIVKTKSYLPIGKNPEPVFVPPHYQSDLAGTFPVDERGSNYFFTFALDVKSIKGEKQPDYIDITADQPTFVANLEDYPRLAEMVAEYQNESADQEA